MNLLLLLLRTSRGTVAVSVFAGAFGGLGSAGLIALVQQALSSPEPAGGVLIAVFVGLSALELITKIVSQALLIGLAQMAVRELIPELQWRGRVVLVISRDERYFGVADRIVRLDYGKLVAELQAYATV